MLMVTESSKISRFAQISARLRTCFALAACAWFRADVAPKRRRWGPGRRAGGCWVCLEDWGNDMGYDVL